ncbi:MAG TPA: hypothetical protein VFH95_04750 [Candidatus Kapabacteria bacterium]|nr:hypothetical protein [Candidatus Kapabacteria bacterium]
MKRVFALLFFLMLPLAPLGAQGLHGKILLVRDTSSYDPHDLENDLPTIYSGTIDSMFSLPDSLSLYDAVLVKDDTLSVADQLTLINYVKGGGKLYIERGLPFRSSAESGTPSDTLLVYLGLTGGALNGTVAHYDLFFGVDSEFTRGLSVPHAHNPIDPDLLDSYIQRGNFIPVLFGGGSVAPDGDIFAWIPIDKILRVVVNYYPVFQAQKAEYYAPFLTRVLCDYFGLCTDAVEEQKPTPSATLRIVSDGDQTWLDVEGGGTGELDIENALGVRVFHCTTSQGGGRIQVPNTLPSGFYFARLQMNGASEMWPFAFVQE